MIGSAELFRSWKEVGTEGLDPVERYVRSEYNDGDLAWMGRPATVPAVREPTLLRRLATALRLRSAGTRLPVDSPAAALRPGIAAVRFAEDLSVSDESRVHVTADAQLLVTATKNWDCADVECLES